MNPDEENIKFKGNFQKHLERWRKSEKIEAFYLSPRQETFSRPGITYAVVSITNKALYIFEPYVYGYFSEYSQSGFLTQRNNAFSIYMGENSHIQLDENIKFNRNKAIQDYGFLESEYDYMPTFGHKRRPVKNKSAVKFAKSLSIDELTKLLRCKCITNRYDLDKVNVSKSENEFSMEILDSQFSENELKIMSDMNKYLLENNKRLIFDITPVNSILSPYDNSNMYITPYNLENDLNTLERLIAK